MAFADPLPSVTLATISQTLPLVFRDGSKAIYQKSDGTLTVTLSQQTKREAGVDRKVTRVVFDQAITATNPQNAELGNVTWHQLHTIIIDRPLALFTETNIVDLVVCWSGFFTATVNSVTNANTKKLVGGET